MKQNLINSMLLGGISVLVLTGCSSNMSNFAADYFSTNPNPLEVVANQVPATVTGTVPPKFFKKNAVVTVTPILVYGDQEKEATSLVYQGEKVRGNNTVISYDNGGTVTIPVNYVYEPEMQSSELYLGFTVEQGSKQYALPRVKVADGIIATATIVDAGDLQPALTADAFQRIINEKYAADIHFLINKADLRKSEVESSEVLNLHKVIVDANEADNLEIKELNIQSYASPDGSLDFNTKLAEKRENVTTDYLNKQLEKDNVTEFGQLTAQFTPEDWEGFQRLVAASNIQDKDLILSVLSMYKDPEQREQEIRNLSSVFDQLAEEILPQLRYSRITASIDVIGKSDEEIAALAASDPSQLTVEELLYAATLTDDKAVKAAIYKQATKQYPNDYRCWNNLGMVEYEMGDYIAAAADFAKAEKLNPTAAEVQLNKGLIALVNNDSKAAQTALGNAAGVDGLGEAMGVYYLNQGDYAAAVKAFGNSKTNNAALAQLLNKDYSKAQATLNAVAEPDATTYYLKAIVAARTNNAAAVVSNLAQVKALDPEMYASAQNDLEFAGYTI